MKFLNEPSILIGAFSVLIDTNVWSELSRPRPNQNVAMWMGGNITKCILSAIVLGEIQFGIANNVDISRRRDLEMFRDDILQKLGCVVTPFDADAASVWGPLRAKLKQAGKLIGERDMLIAAHALSLGVPLVTRNVEEMAKTGAIIVNPWEG